MAVFTKSDKHVEEDKYGREEKPLLISGGIADQSFFGNQSVNSPPPPPKKINK